MTYHKSHWTKRQVRNLNKAVQEGATIAFTLTGPEGEPYNGGKSPRDQYARQGLVQESKGPFKLCQPGVFHATLEPHRWRGSRVWIVALYGEIQREGDFKLGALKREFIGEILSHEAMDPRIGAKLGRKDLAGADLHWANLYGADLSGASLYEAALSYANLSGADLSGADLSKADLRYSTLYEANLSEASLNKASLYRADLTGADLSWTDLGNWERGPDGYARRKQ
jgi:uncharacterized protein YjbI with pentapeptide repeats